MSMDNPHEENRTRKPYMTWAGLMFAASILFSATSFQLLAGICVLLFLLFAIIGLADKYVTNRGVPVRKDRALNIFANVVGGAVILTILLQLLIPAIHSARMTAKRAEETKAAQINTEHLPKDGPYVSYFNNGDTKIEGNIKNGKQDGLWILWHENGKKKSEGNFKNGLQDGLWTIWHENGQKKQEGEFKNGKSDGLWILWHENGQKQWEGQCKDGKEDGLATFWYENGQKKEEGHFYNGSPDGLWTEWDESGNKTLEVQLKDGKEVSRKEF